MEQRYVTKLSLGVWRWNIAEQKRVLLGSDSPIINVRYLLSKDTVPLCF